MRMPVIMGLVALLSAPAFSKEPPEKALKAAVVTAPFLPIAVAKEIRIPSVVSTQYEARRTVEEYIVKFLRASITKCPKFDDCIIQYRGLEVLFKWTQTSHWKISVLRVGSQRIAALGNRCVRVWFQDEDLRVPSDERFEPSIVIQSTRKVDRSEYASSEDCDVPKAPGRTENGDREIRLEEVI